MSQCQHSDGAFCLVCGEGTNSCCGDGRACDECLEVCCFECLEVDDNGDGEFICPGCSGFVVSTDALIDYLLAKFQLSRAVVAQEIKDQRRQSRGNEEHCAACADGGLLLLCDGCTRSYHAECAAGTHNGNEWFCPGCVKRIAHWSKRRA